MTTFRTRTGLYEVDDANRLVRCLARTTDRGGSRRLPPGGDWVDYEDVEHDGVGSRLVVYFKLESNPVTTSEIIEVVPFGWD